MLLLAAADEDSGSSSLYTSASLRHKVPSKILMKNPLSPSNSKHKKWPCSSLYAWANDFHPWPRYKFPPALTAVFTAQLPFSQSSIFRCMVPATMPWSFCANALGSLRRLSMPLYRITKNSKPRSSGVMSSEDGEGDTDGVALRLRPLPRPRPRPRPRPLMVPLAGDMSSEDGEGDTDGMALPLRPLPRPRPRPRPRPLLVPLAMDLDGGDLAKFE